MMTHTSFTAERLIVVRCCTCGKVYADVDPEQDFNVFDTVQDAVEYMQENEDGWVVQAGTLKAFCPDHHPEPVHRIPSHIRDQY